MFASIYLPFDKLHEADGVSGQKKFRGDVCFCDELVVLPMSSLAQGTHALVERFEQLSVNADAAAALGAVFL